MINKNNRRILIITKVNERNNMNTTKRVYIAFYDGRVARVFRTWELCERFVEMRVFNGSTKWRNKLDPEVILDASGLNPFGTKFEYDDDRGNHHEWWSADYEIEG